MANGDGGALTELGRALKVWRHAFNDIIAALRAIRDPQVRFEQTAAFVDEARKAWTAVRAEKAQAAANIAEVEDLSLAQLAKRVGVSKARAGQWAKEAKEKT